MNGDAALARDGDERFELVEIDVLGRLLTIAPAVQSTWAWWAVLKWGRGRAAASNFLTAADGESTLKHGQTMRLCFLAARARSGDGRFPAQKKL